jgi:hypothetical protein
MFRFDEKRLNYLLHTPFCSNFFVVVLGKYLSPRDIRAYAGNDGVHWDVLFRTFVAAHRYHISFF